VIQDISDSKHAAAALKKSEEQFRHLAQYDILTKLPNRALYHDRLTHALLEARRNSWRVGVLFIDVDQFKSVNDTFGHAVGDELLKEIAERLARCVRSNDTVGRLSGDEFAIVLGRITSPSDTALVAKKIIDEFSRSFLLSGTELLISVSIGITVSPADGNDQEVLMRNADAAMYQAKQRGRNNYQFYTAEMNGESPSYADSSMSSVPLSIAKN
jgi:diguanylate cyclase (GGDEF)-like protein